MYYVRLGTTYLYDSIGCGKYIPGPWPTLSEVLTTADVDETWLSALGPLRDTDTDRFGSMMSITFCSAGSQLTSYRDSVSTRDLILDDSLRLAPWK